MDEKTAQQQFLTALLQWDYGAMFEKYEKGEGLVDTLPKIGHTFSSVEVLPISLVHAAWLTTIMIGTVECLQSRSASAERVFT
jgi:hypothetical protein